MTRSTPPPSSLVAVAPTGATTVPAIVQIETAFKRLTTATTQTFTVNNYDGSETKCTILKNKDGTEIVTEVKTFPDGEKVAKEIIRNTSTGRQRKYSYNIVSSTRWWCKCPYEVLGARSKKVIVTSHFPLYWPCVRGICQLVMDSPHKGQGMCSFDVFLVVVSLNKLLNKQSMYRTVTYLRFKIHG